MTAIIFNTFWIILEKLCFAGGGIISAMFVARYLGPANFGAFSYLLSIVILIMPFVQLGSDNILFNRIAKNRYSGMRLMTASVKLKFKMFMLFSAALMIWASLNLKHNEVVILALLLLSTFFSIHDIYKIFFDATLRSKINLIINNCALILFIILNLTFVYLKLSLVWFAVAYVVARSFVPFMIRRLLFSYSQKTLNRLVKMKLTPRHIKKYHLYLLQVGFPLAISSLSIVIYTRIDQIMLAKYLGSYAVGLYSAAQSITQGWAIIPSALVTSMMSTIVREKSSSKADELIHLLYVIAISTFIPVIAVVSLLSGPIIDLIYGKAYHAAAGILLIGAVTTCFSVMGTVAYRVIIMNAGFRFVAVKMPLIAVLNIALNSYLIPLYGIKGAAFATLLSEFSSLFILNAFFRKGLITSQILSSYKSIPLLISEVKHYAKSNR
ncbi:flippase [Candidatus Sodalis sp. SoCistrobi]|uniref:flippase n=1 Tax=Candidatus Sodalis sp. SoCistrobi TaxID=1922216 RepID=UPI000939814D|nr:flippase [Candidatus Sodalis sp. SoCistrobi]